MKYMRYNSGKMSNDDCLSLLRKNLQCLNDCLDIHFDSIFRNNTHWLHAITFISQKIPPEIKNALCRPGSCYAPILNNHPAHINQALQQPNTNTNPPSGQFQLMPPSPIDKPVYTLISTMDELSTHVNDCYNVFHAQLTNNQTPNVKFEAL